MQTLLRTPLYERHVALGARLVPFAGWEMPVQYEGVIPEHRAVRTDAGLFDVSHMGELEVEGPGARELLQAALSNDLDRIGPGHHVIWVNIYLPEKPARQENWNAALDAAALERPSEMCVLDWATLAAENRDWIGDDGIHCSSKGYVHRATAIATATRSLVPAIAPVRSARLWSQIPPG